ncbi:MAG: plastocyanin/azurin family copper-binding protein [Solirubrobacterales bacterium]
MRSRILLVALVVVALGLAGCGGDDAEEEAIPARGAEQPAGGAKAVEMSEYAFAPSDVTAERGQTITLENAGEIVHNFTVEEGPDPDTPSKELAATPNVQPGESAELEVDLEPGEYALVCTVPSHRDLGMTGSFTVE